MRRYANGDVKPLFRGTTHLLASVYYFRKIIENYYSEDKYRNIIASQNVIFFTQTAISGIYHFFDHTEKVERELRKLDHSCIYLLGAMMYYTYMRANPKYRYDTFVYIHSLLTIKGIEIKYTKPLLCKSDVIAMILPPLLSIIPILSSSNNKERIYCLGIWFFAFLHLICIKSDKDLYPKYFDYHDLGHVFVIIMMNLTERVTLLKLERISYLESKV